MRKINTIRSFAFLVVIGLFARPLSSQSVYLVKDLLPGSLDGLGQPGSYIIETLDTLAVMIGRSAGNQNVLWSSDGTEAGTQIIIPAGGSYPCFTKAYGKLWLMREGSSNSLEVWESDGTPAGTVKRVTTIGSAEKVVAFQGNLYYSNGNKLMKYDTAAHTVSLVTTFSPFDPVYDLAALPDKLLLISQKTGGLKLFVSDGTDAGTVGIYDLNWLNGENYHLTAAGDKAYFFAALGDGTETFYITDGTTGGTLPLVEEEAPHFDFNALGTSLMWNDKFLFQAEGPAGSGSRDLYITDGTVQGTIKLQNLFTDPDILNLTPYQDKVYFSVEGGFTDIWETDGTVSGTKKTFQFSEFPYSGYGLAVFQDSLVFSGYDSNFESGLYISAGNFSSARLISDAVGGFNGNFVPTPAKMFFINYDAEHGRELWAYDPFKATSGTNEDIKPERRLIVTPNPANDFIRIGYDDQWGVAQTLSVRSMTGQIVRSWQLTGGQSNFPVSGIAPGIYVAVLNTSQGVLVQKLVID
ncbi:MAG: T9SS C-terminal target domain-containing protein [Haliscomenobacteraceae bacterium CHB4]|nr:hypothetical protein [Saprospiraceae bacterium]MCE7924235.1 T9SS C-terminal target domain-containing protein [Haliscomenobacteraceae bacterium CHB4]